MIPQLGVKLLIIIFTGLSSWAHPYYVSIFQLNHNAENQTLQVTCKIFTDDLETAIESQGTDQLELGSDRELNKSDEYIAQYIRNHFKIAINGKPREMRYLGKEVDLDVTWAYLEISNIPTINSMNVENNILFEHFSTQTNIIHTEVGTQKKSVILKKEKPSHRFVYKK
jgi:hypothetical protein